MTPPEWTDTGPELDRAPEAGGDVAELSGPAAPYDQAVADRPPEAGGAPPTGAPPTGAPPTGAPRPPPARGTRSPRRYRPRRRRGVLLVVVVVVVVAALVAAFLWVRSEAAPASAPGPQVVVAVRSGAGMTAVAGDLASRGVIGSTLAFRAWNLLHGTPTVRPGSYAFRKGAGFAAVDATLSSGPNVFALDVPPGFTVAELARRVGQLPGHSAAHFAAVAAGGTVRSPYQPAGTTTLDGLLAPGSYRVVPGETDARLLTAMIGRFDARAAAAGLDAGAARLGLTPYQLVTVASIVQKEGVVEKNLGPVARVILNRLAAGMPLQMDSTVLYAEGRDGGTVTGADLSLDTPYNTYRTKGLTPTPICFPSTASLAAALHPPAGSWQYFVVVDRDGTEAFATTYAGQLANEALARQRGLP